MVIRLRSLKTFLRDDSGATLFEFLLLTPTLFILAFAILEFTSLQLARIRTDRSAYIIANIITQLSRAEQKPVGQPSYFTVDDAQLDAILNRAEDMLPTATRMGAKVVVSGFTYMDRIYPNSTGPAQPVGAPVLLWAKGRVFDANPQNSPSTVSVLGSNVVWPSSVQMQRITFLDDNTRNAIATYGTFQCPENVVLVEVFYDYAPIFKVLEQYQFIDRRTLVSRAFLRPRSGDIEAVANSVSFNQPAAVYQNTKQRGGFCTGGSPSVAGTP